MRRCVKCVLPESCPNYKVFKPEWDIAKKLYALFFRKTGEFCKPYNTGIWSSSYKIAKEMDIPLIVRGSSAKNRKATIVFGFYNIY